MKFEIPAHVHPARHGQLLKIVGVIEALEDPNLRLATALRHLAGMEHQDVAAALGLPAEEYRQLKIQGMQALRDGLVPMAAPAVQPRSMSQV